MKKILIIIISLFTFLNVAKADGSAIWASANSINVGSSVIVSVKTNGVGGMFKVVSSDNSILSLASGETDSLWIEDDTKTFKFTSKKEGTATITAIPIDASTSNLEEYTEKKSVTIQIVSPTNNQNTAPSITTNEKKSYSDDNSLKKIEVEGYNIDFKSDILEYSIDVDETVEKIKVNATANHEKAGISGTGEINLSSGNNTVEIKVTAENGNEKIYKINIKVSDINPIEVTVAKKKYTLIKKNNDLIKKLDYFEEKTTKINDVEVVCYYNETNKLTLVLLKDSNNKIDYYIYNEITKEYSPYNYIKYGNISLNIVDYNKKIENFTKYKTTINDKITYIYKINKSDKIGLVYGTNLSSGNTSFYVYDELEGTLSRYYQDEIKIYKNKLKDYKDYMMIFIGIFSLILIFIIIFSIKLNKCKKRY